jgi:hypothetical protein
MRLLIIVMTLALFVAVLGFLVTNLETRIPLQIWQTVHPDVPLYLIVILAVVVGVIYAGIIAAAEGAHVRLANRRLTREIRKLETELNYLRTEPPTRPRPEPDELPSGGDEERSDRAGIDGDDSPASRPIYSAEDDWPPDDDDAYSGGRAV